MNKNKKVKTHQENLHFKNINKTFNLTNGIPLATLTL